MKTPNKLICLTPVKNEAWILDKFLTCVSIWADHIIIADQLSTDGSREIALKYPKVILINNNTVEFNEPERQALLLKEARKIEGPKILFTLDSDEFLTANFSESPEWEMIRYAEPGYIFRFNWVNILPGFERGWIIGNFAWAFADDGTSHKGIPIHSPRLPLPDHGHYVNLSEIKVLHYQYTDWKRMQSKHCWYQCYECLNFPEKKIVTLFRLYNHMYTFRKRKKYNVPLKQEWFENYEKLGIDMKSINKQNYWWDKEVVKLLLKDGTKKFSYAYIWYRDWNNIKKQYFVGEKSTLNDPRNIFLKILHTYLFWSQPYRHALVVRGIDRLLKAYGL